MTYDSTADTLLHSRRVGELLVSVLDALAHRAVNHDLSKTKSPELEMFNEFTPKLKHSTYGSDEYKGFLAEMQEGLKVHYANNRHHPEHYREGISGMTLIDLIEMLADWKAATERHDDGDIQRSLEINQERFEIDDQLQAILTNTILLLGWFH
jgi:hypothetical protein